MTRGVALALTVLTGFSGLVYEVTWEKYLRVRETISTVS